MDTKRSKMALEHWDSEELIGMAPETKTTPDEAPTSTQEGAEGNSAAEAHFLGGSGTEWLQADADEPEAGGPEKPAEKTEPAAKKDRKAPGAKKVWPWVVVLLLILAAAGAAAWYFWDHKGNEEKYEPGTGMGAEVDTGVLENTDDYSEHTAALEKYHEDVQVEKSKIADPTI